MPLDDRVRRVLRDAPHLSMVQPDPGCKAVRADYASQELNEDDVAAVLEALAEHGGRVERKAPLERRGLRPGRLVRRIDARSAIWHVPLVLLESDEPDTRPA